MFTWRFWREAIERAIKSGAQAVILALGGSEILNLFEMDAVLLLGVAASGAFLSILTSLTTVGVGASDSPSAIE